MSVRASMHPSRERAGETGEGPEPPVEAANRPPTAATVLRFGGLAGTLLLAWAGARSGQRGIAWPTWFAGTVVLTGSWLLLRRDPGGGGLRGPAGAPGPGGPGGPGGLALGEGEGGACGGPGVLVTHAA